MTYAACWRCLKRTIAKGRVHYIPLHRLKLPLTLPQPLCQQCLKSFAEWVEEGTRLL